MMIEQVRKIVALACEYRAQIDVVFEKDGDVRVAIYPVGTIEIKASAPIEFEEQSVARD